MSNLRNTKVLTAAALLTAIGIIAGFFKIPITNLIEIRFASIPIAAAGALFGPGIAAIVGILTDIGGFLVKPTGPYFPGFTISGAVSGLIYGIMLHRKDNNQAAFSTKRCYREPSSKFALALYPVRKRIYRIHHSSRT